MALLIQRHDGCQWQKITYVDELFEANGSTTTTNTVASNSNYNLFIYY